jgi:SLAP domain-containing protein
MQKLQYEASWDKALPMNDRERIISVFKETNTHHQPTIKFTPLWQATNHRGELLITVLVHNFSRDVFSFNNTKLSYIAENEVIAEHAFTIPALAIQPETSMPWAFIFPVESLNNHLNSENGHLEFAD